MHKISPALCYLVAPLILIKFCAGWGMCCISWIVYRTSYMFVEEGKIYSGLGLRAVAFINWIMGIWNLGVLGCFSFEKVKIDVDYKEYLGPDSEIVWDGQGSVISNHTSFMDIMVHTRVRIPAHICKKATLQIPWVGSGTAMCGSLFVERTSKDSKSNTLSQLADHQIKAEKGEAFPLIIYAEGGTTNGKYLI